eukprot:1671336-Rhodomonas_salina.1
MTWQRHHQLRTPYSDGVEARGYLNHLHAAAAPLLITFLLLDHLFANVRSGHRAAYAWGATWFSGR